MSATSSMTISCNGCPVRGSHCEECMVTALLDPTATGASGDLPPDPDERRVVADLVRLGMLGEEEALSARARREPFVVSRAVG